MLDEVRFNLKYAINGFEKFEINADLTAPTVGTKGSYRLVTDFSTNSKKYYTEGGVTGETTKDINAYNYNVALGSSSGYRYSKLNITTSSQETEIQESLNKATLENGYSIFSYFPEITEKNIIDFSKEEDVYVIKVKMTEVYGEYYRSTDYITYKIKDNKFTEISYTSLLEVSETLSDEVDSLGNSYLNHPTIMQIYSLTANFEYGDDVDLEFLNNGISAIDARIVSGDLTYREE